MTNFESSTVESQRPGILVVDDSPTNLKILVSVLERDHDVLVATSGLQALALLDKLAIEGALPDLILLDVMMPEMSGYEMCRTLNELGGTVALIPVIFVTALNDMGSEVHALEIGGVDFISKPIQPSLVTARVKLHLKLVQQRHELEALNHQLAQNLAALDDARQREQLFNATIQQDLLFGDVPTVIAGHEIACYRAPSQIVDGDFYTFSELTDDVFEVLIGDVMGKGIHAAMVGAGVKNAYREAYYKLLMADSNKELPSPAEVVNQMHASLILKLMGLGLFVTLSLLRFDRRTGCLTQVNAGHTPTLVIRPGNVSPEELMGVNLPLGILDNEIYEEQTLTLGRDDLVCVYSDGLPDACNLNGESFGMQGVRDSLLSASTSHRQPNAVIDQVQTNLMRFTQGVPLSDDTSLIIVKAPGPLVNV